MKDPEVTYNITLYEACKLISKDSGKNITPETHWIKSSIELTRDSPPYVIIKLEAYKR